MKKVGDKIYLTEDEVSPSYLYPDCVRTTNLPLCNVCRNWNGPGKCKKLGMSPDVYCEGEKRDCPDAVLDKEKIGFPEFIELYPEDTKKLLERPPQ